MNKLPKRWTPYSNIGKKIEGTRIVCFKVPLKEHFFSNRPELENLIFTPNMLMKEIPNLGFVIDLTATDRYYSPTEFTNNGIEFKKIFVEGHVIPKKENILQFNNAVNNFISKSTDENSVIGVHCTHGVNRTGFLVCAYMISHLNLEPNTAIARFNKARGHPLERSNYIEELSKYETGVDFNTYVSKNVPIEPTQRIRTRWGYTTIDPNSKPYENIELNVDVSDKNGRNRNNVQPIINNRDQYYNRNINNRQRISHYDQRNQPHDRRRENEGNFGNNSQNLSWRRRDSNDAQQSSSHNLNIREYPYDRRRENEGNFGNNSQNYSWRRRDSNDVQQSSSHNFNVRERSNEPVNQHSKRNRRPSSDNLEKMCNSKKNKLDRIPIPSTEVHRKTTTTSEHNQSNKQIFNKDVRLSRDTQRSSVTEHTTQTQPTSSTQKLKFRIPKKSAN